MDIQQPTTLAESRKAPIVVGSGDWLGGCRVATTMCGMTNAQNVCNEQ
jgi:predicted NAD/FAD-dependent oxidoreductase